MALNANGVFATSAESADGNAEKSGFPIFPKENPTREQYDLWVLHATNYLNNAGFSALLRGDMLRETTKLADRTRLPVPSDAAAIAAVGAENAKIDSINAANKAERESIEREYKVRLDAKLTLALLPKAKLRLSALHKAHPLKNSAGADVDGAYDGLAMWKALKAHGKKIDESDGVGKKHTKRLEEIRDNKLPDNVDPQTFADVIVELNDLMPFVDVPYTGEAYVKLVLGLAPDALSVDLRMMEEKLKSEKLMADEAEAVQRVGALIAKVHDPAAEPVFKLTQAGVAAMMTKASAEGAKAAKAAVIALGSDRRGAVPKQTASEKEVKAAAKKRRGSSRLPEGQRCKAGTCGFDHDERKPDAPCFRDPRKAVELPAAVFDDNEQLERIKADRVLEGKRLGVTPLPVTRERGAAPPAPRTTTGGVPPGGNPLSVIDMLNSSCMLSSPIGDDVDDDEYDGGYSHWAPLTSGLASPLGGAPDDGAGVIPRDERSSPVLPQVLLGSPPVSPVVTTPAQPTAVSDSTSAKTQPTLGLGSAATTTEVAAKGAPPVLGDATQPQSTATDSTTNTAPLPPIMPAEGGDAPISFSFAGTAAHVLTSVCLAAGLAMIVLLLLQLGGGHPASSVVFNTIVLVACQGGSGFAGSLGLSTAACVGAPVFHDVALKMLMGMFAALFLTLQLAESSLVPLVNAALYRGGALFIRGARDALHWRAHAHRSMGRRYFLCAGFAPALHPGG
jgi:hypothetical protein